MGLYLLAALATTTSHHYYTLFGLCQDSLSILPIYDSDLRFLTGAVIFKVMLGLQFENLLNKTFQLLVFRFILQGKHLVFVGPVLFQKLSHLFDC